MRSLGSMAGCAHLGCWADPCSAVRSCGWRVLHGGGGALSPHPGKSRDPRGKRTTIGSAGPRGSPAALGSALASPNRGIAVPAPPLPATRLGRGTTAPGLRSPRVSVGCPRPRSTSFCLPSFYLLPLRTFASAGCTPQVPTLGSQPVPSARDWRPGARREGLGESGQ